MTVKNLKSLSFMLSSRSFPSNFGLHHHDCNLQVVDRKGEKKGKAKRKEREEKRDREEE